MKKNLRGIKKTVQDKIKEKEVLITNIIKIFIEGNDYKLNVKLILCKSKLKIIVSSLKSASKLKLDFEKISNISTDITIPTFCNIASKMTIIKDKDENNKRTINL